MWAAGGFSPASTAVRRDLGGEGASLLAFGTGPRLRTVAWDIPFGELQAGTPRG